MNGGLKIGELAGRAGVTAKAIRFYERKRLLPPAKRAANHYRLYDDDAVGMLYFVKAPAVRPRAPPLARQAPRA